MRRIDDWLTAYGDDHKNIVNKNIHKVCVPLIMFSLLGILWELPFFRFLGFPHYINIATLFSVVILMYYLILDAVYAMLMFFVCLFMFYIISLVDMTESEITIYLLIFFTAWVGQFIGHKFEGKKPSFLEDLQFLLIGPLWVLRGLRNKIVNNEKSLVRLMEERRSTHKDWRTDYKTLISYLIEKDMIVLEEVRDVLEVGTAWGDGALYLSSRFKNAKVSTIDLVQPFDDYAIHDETIMKKLKGRANYIRVDSPPDTIWSTKYDFICIDITTNSEVNYKNLLYWHEYLNEGGVLSILIPKSDKRRKKQKENFINLLGKHYFDYHFMGSYFILKKS